ncbi:MAG: hypothetical protein ACLS7Z_13585 [Christensenellales bacterium]
MRAIGRQAVDEVIAGVLPEGKESVIRSLQKAGQGRDGRRRHQRRARSPARISASPSARART